MSSRVVVNGAWVFENGSCAFVAASGTAVDFSPVLSTPVAQEILGSLLGAGVAEMLGTPPAEEQADKPKFDSEAWLNQMTKTFEAQAGPNA